MTIAVDFDGTLCEDRWPEIGKPNRDVILCLLYRQAMGDRIILWTCREGKRLEEAVLWCINQGLRFDAVNDNLPENRKKYGGNCRKVFADEYWDDKSVIANADMLCGAFRDGYRPAAGVLAKGRNGNVYKVNWFERPDGEAR